MTRQPAYTLSVVSHGQMDLLRHLLSDVRHMQPPPQRIVVTLNIPEAEDALAAFAELPLLVLRNAAPLGFGANHNAAFAHAVGDVFAIVNPDVRASPFDVRALFDTLAEDRVGACAPRVLSPTGNVEDSARRFPTLRRLARRVLRRERHPDYAVDFSGSLPVDWVAGMFVAFRRVAFSEVGGFDAAYFMYMEDADICRRLWHAGWQVRWSASCSVVHDAQRASRRKLRYLLWHLRSAAVFLSRG